MPSWISWLKWNVIDSSPTVCPPHHQAKFPVVEAAGPLCACWETDWSEGTRSHPPILTGLEEELGFGALQEVVAGWGTIQPGSSLWLIHLIIRHRALPVEPGWLHKGNILERILSIFAHLRQFDSRIWCSKTTSKGPHYSNNISNTHSAPHFHSIDRDWPQNFTL